MTAGVAVGSMAGAAVGFAVAFAVGLGVAFIAGVAAGVTGGPLIVKVSVRGPVTLTNCPSMLSSVTVNSIQPLLCRRRRSIP